MGNLLHNPLALPGPAAVVGMLMAWKACAPLTRVEVPRGGFTGQDDAKLQLQTSKDARQS